MSGSFSNGNYRKLLCFQYIFRLFPPTGLAGQTGHTVWLAGSAWHQPVMPCRLTSVRLHYGPCLWAFRFAMAITHTANRTTITRMLPSAITSS